MPYTNRELERFLARAVGQFTPTTLLQILQMELGVPHLREVIWRILNRYCSHFLRRARKWKRNPDLSPLETMRDYHQLWEGFHCCEPYHNSRNQKIRYFMNSQHEIRLEEMEDQFIV